ncbi:MAG: hypothetical protein WCS65_14575 [Verrucomicrobiae bacterium]|jgi:hypothetical protein
MDISLINSQSLLRLLALTEKKEELLSLVDNIDAAIIATLKGGVSVEVVEIASAPASVAPAQKPVAALKAPAKPARAKKAKGGKSGGLKEKILALLETAGSEGLKVKEIADKLGAKPGNISVWFSTTGKKLVTKVEPGRYAVKGAAKPASKPATAVAPAAVKAAKPAKAKKKSGLTPEGRAKLAANMKARWAARKAGKPAAKIAKKGFKLPKKS